MAGKHKMVRLAPEVHELVVAFRDALSADGPAHSISSAVAVAVKAAKEQPLLLRSVAHQTALMLSAVAASAFATAYSTSTGRKVGVCFSPDLRYVEMRGEDGLPLVSVKLAELIAGPESQGLVDLLSDPEGRAEITDAWVARRALHPPSQAPGPRLVRAAEA